MHRYVHAICARECLHTHMYFLVELNVTYMYVSETDHSIT